VKESSGGVGVVELEDKVQQLEQEIAQMKVEITEVLLDLRELLRPDEHPLSCPSSTEISEQEVPT